MSHKQECQAAEGGWGRAAPLCQPGPDVSKGPACLSGLTSRHSLRRALIQPLLWPHGTIKAPKVPSSGSPPGLPSALKASPPLYLSFSHSPIKTKAGITSSRESSLMSPCPTPG